MTQFVGWSRLRPCSRGLQLTRSPGLAAALIPGGKVLSDARELHLMPSPCQCCHSAWGSLAGEQLPAPCVLPPPAPRARHVGHWKIKTRALPRQQWVLHPSSLSLSLPPNQPGSPTGESKLTVLPSLWSHQCQISLSRAQSYCEWQNS